jgi:hypothetical protein
MILPRVLRLNKNHNEVTLLVRCVYTSCVFNNQQWSPEHKISEVSYFILVQFVSVMMRLFSKNIENVFIIGFSEIISSSVMYGRA